MMTDTVLSRWWYLDLMAEFPELEIYTGGWGPEQELADIELGDRVTTEEALWLTTWIYSTERDRHWAAVSGMVRMVCDRVRRDRPIAEKVLALLAGDDPDQIPVSRAEIPDGWYPDTEAWQTGRLP